MEYEETDFTPPATNVHKVVRAKSKKKKKVQNEETSVISEVVSSLYAGIAQSARDKLRGIGGDEDKKKKDPADASGASDGDTSGDPSTPAEPKDSTPAEAPDYSAPWSESPEERCANAPGWAGSKESDPWKDCPGRWPDDYKDPPPGYTTAEPSSTPSSTPSSAPSSTAPSSTAPAGPAGGHQQMTPDGSVVNPAMPWTPPIKGEEKRSNISPSGANESMFHVASVLREDDEDENYSYDEINQDKDPDAAGGPYSEDDIKVTKDPRDAAPGMDPVADPPTQQAKQVTTGMAYKAPAAAGTMQTMLPGGEHDAIQKQYPDLIENLLGCGSDMKGGFLADPKDKKKAMAAMALMASLDKKLKEDKKTRLKKILNTTKPPAIPGSEGY